MRKDDMKEMLSKLNLSVDNLSTYLMDEGKFNEIKRKAVKIEESAEETEANHAAITKTQAANAIPAQIESNIFFYLYPYSDAD